MIAATPPATAAPPQTISSPADRCDNLLRVADVKKRKSLARTAIYNRMNAGTFPKVIQISRGLVAWYESDIDVWMANRMGWRQSA